MADVDSTSADRIEERKDLGTDDAARYAYWMAQEAIATKEERQWVKKSKKIVERYRDERPETGIVANQHRFNILWSNVQTLIPTLYARTPKPDVQRRWPTPDPTGRLAAILLEQCLSYSIDSSVESEFDTAMKAVVQDRLLPGRGVARVLYVPHFGDEIEPKGGDEDEGAEDQEDRDAAAVVDSEGDEDEAKDEALRTVDFEEVIPRYVFWEDYQEGAARQWVEVPWVRYRSYLTRSELTERFGRAKGKQVNLDFTPKGSDQDNKTKAPPDLYKKAIVHECWDKLKGEVVWYAPGTPGLILDCKSDPLKLPGFFPNPDPLLSTTTNDKRIPVPDYIEYQDQARELDRLTQRIDVLTQALRVVGLYPGENKQELQQLFDAGDNRMVPVADWAGFMKEMGPNGFIVYLPIKQIAETLIQLYNARDRVKALLYEITGLSDILRGATVPTETLGAQELKANFATRRISPQQKDVARFARDMLRLMAGVIAAHFSPQTISLMTGYPQLAPVPQLPPMPQIPPQVMMAIMQAQHAAQAPQLAAPMMNGGSPDPQVAVPHVAPQPGMNGGGPPVAPPQPQIDPAIAQAMQAFQQAMAQWQQAKAQVDQITAQNQQKQAQFDAAVKLLKDDGPHGFRIDIETDSTIAPDEDAEKKARVEFLSQMVPLLENVIPVAQGNPALSDLVKEIVMFAARGFKVARSMEESFEKAFDAIGKMPPNPPSGQKAASQGQQGPHPAQLAADAQTSAQETAADVATKGHKIAAEVEIKGHKIAADAQTSAHAEDTKLAIARMQTLSKQQSDAADRELEAVKIAGEHQLGQQRLALETENILRQHSRDDRVAAHQQASDASKLE